MTQATSSIAAGTGTRLSAKDIRTLALAALGGALEFYDFIIFVFFTVTIGQLFFPPDTPDWLRQFQAFGIFAAGYLARPVGGVVMAHFGDRVGRKRMFTLSVFLMALPTLVIGLLPTYAQIGLWAPLALLALRILQGAAIGGEVPGAWVFVSEHVPAGKVGLACGSLTAGLTLGILLGSLTATAINLSFSPEQIGGYAWRIPFLLGGVFGLFAVWLRRWLEETPVFEELRARKALTAELPLKRVLRGHYGSVALSMLSTWMLTAAIVVIILMTPTLLQKFYAVPARDALIANSFATLTLTFGCILAGQCVDRFGAGRCLGVGSVLLFITSWALFLGVRAWPQALLPLYGIAGFGVGVVGVVPSVMVNEFPPAIRFSGISFSYNMAYALFGGLTPLLLSLLTTLSPLAPAYYVGALCVLGCVCGLIARSRESAPG